MWFLASALGCVGALAAPTAALVPSPSPRPDIIFVLADDLAVSDMADLPRIRALVGEPGVTFDNDFVSLSLCCPSRCSTLTGQYAHNTGVYRNSGKEGGFAAFHAGGEGRTIATELAAAGYRTGLFGKYLNGYPGDAPATWVPPGWTSWFAVSGNGGYPEFDYTLNENGTLRRHGHADTDYLVDVLSARAGDFLVDAGALPAFVWVAPMVPHTPAVAAPRYAGRFADRHAPRSPNFNEEDVSDKPEPLASHGVLPERALESIDVLYRHRLASSLALEDLVQHIVDVQTTRGRLGQTWLVFASDNGFHLGEHRMPRGKETEYDEDLRVPLLVRGPGVEAGSHVDALTLNTDLAPTFAAMAGLSSMPGADGRSWLGLVTGRSRPPWRDAFLIERAGGKSEEPESDDDGRARRAGYVGIRTKAWKYVEFTDGQRELFDLATDPYELENVSTPDPSLVATLSARLHQLAACEGEDCRTAENPAPPAN